MTRAKRTPSLARPITFREELLIVDREHLERRLGESHAVRRLGPVWVLDLDNGGTTMLTVDESRILYSYKRPEERIPIGREVIAAMERAVMWLSVAQSGTRIA